MNTIDAVFDGSVFRPNEPVNLEPNTKVRLTITPGGIPPVTMRPKIEFAKKAPGGEPYSFFKAAREANIEGPPDWSENIDKYLYGDLASDADESPLP